MRNAGERDWMSTKLSLILRMFNYFQRKGKASVERTELRKSELKKKNKELGRCKTPMKQNKN